MQAIALAASSAIFLAYLAIFALITTGLIRSGQLTTNRLGAATAAIFFSCSVGHGIHATHLVEGHKADWHLAVWDTTTAIIAIVYLSMRGLYGKLLDDRPQLFGDLERQRLQDELAEAQTLAQVGSWSIDLDSGARRHSAEFRRIFGIEVAEATDAEVWSRVAPGDAARVRAAMDALAADGVPLDETFELHGAGRDPIIVQCRGRREPLGPSFRITGTVQDITERTRDARALLSAEAGFRAAFEQAGVPTAVVSLEAEDFGTIRAGNAAYAELLGRSLGELVGHPVTMWMHPEDRDRAFDAPLRRLAAGEVSRLQFERRYLHRDGHVVWTLVNNAAYHDAEGRHVAIGQILDISERKTFEGQLQHLADHDALTGLFNRRRLERELERMLAHTRRFGGTGAVLALDLDGFKYVNDSLGHAAGDDLVVRLAETLQRSLRETDVIARTGGDEFAVLLPETTAEDAQLVAGKLLEAIRAGGSLLDGRRRARITTSIGITLFTQGDQVIADDLMVEADIAMYDAKHAGKDRFCVFRRDDGGRRERITARQDWLVWLREAIEDHRFVLFAQPIVPVCSAGVPYFELLLRLPDEHGDLLPPGAFLPNAERFGLTGQIDGWVLAEAVRTLAEEHAAGRDIALSVNISASTVNAGAIASHLAALLQGHAFPRERLVVEITETAAIANIEQARDFARDVRALGCRLALDDFGAGFATFYYLKHLDFDYVKIDGEFIKRLPETGADQLVVRAVVDIARGLGSDTVAEYVQDDATLDLLRELGVGFAQGYHTGRPVPLTQILAATQQA